jgi:hypothetical protein
MSINEEQILGDQELLTFSSYEDYLDSMIRARDIYHLRSKSMSRKIIELGYHTERTLSRYNFYKRVQFVKRHLYLLQNPYDLCSKSVDLKDILLQELALREKANRIGELYTIIFIRYIKDQSQISAYIDYSYRLKTEDWLLYFNETEQIKPRKSDLSYYDWKYRIIILNESPNFKPIVDGKNGLVFQNKHDLKFVAVNSALTPESDLARTSVYSKMYGHVALYDYSSQIPECE